MNYRVTPQIGLPVGELVVDSFCGGGGASMGIELAIGRPVDIAINHNKRAISMHEVNHPHTTHYNQSVWDVDPVTATHGQPVGLAWFSPDCRHHSKAKGGKPVEKNIRGLAWIVLKWAAKAKPRVIFLENVEEFRDWGPLTRSNRPCKKRKGQTFELWKRQLESLGYRVEHQTLKACDYGAPTTRKRLFLVARRDGLPIVWPAATHGPKGSGLKKYKTAADIIDWSLPCPSIFDRKKPLAENTLKRIAKGLQKFVLDNPKPFTLSDKQAAHFIARIGQTGWSKGGQQYDIENPLTTCTTKAEHLLVTAFISRHKFMAQGTSASEPLPTITAGGASKRPAGAAHSLALTTGYLVKLRNNCTGTPLNAPVDTISSQGTHLAKVTAFLIKYFGTGTGQQLDQPLDTITTRDRFGLVTIAGDDYQIIDIGMRMLQPHELFAAQGFPRDYVFTHDGEGKPFTKADQVAMCGNSVCPPVAKALVEANYSEQQIIEVAA